MRRGAYAVRSKPRIQTPMTCVYTNDFQPMHAYHEHVIERSMRTFKKVLVFVRGAEKADPFDFETRKHMIHRMLCENVEPVADVDRLVSVIGLPDLDLSQEEWWTMMFYNAISYSDGAPRINLMDPAFKVRVQGRFPVRLRKYFDHTKPRNLHGYVVPEKSYLLKLIHDVKKYSDEEYEPKLLELHKLMNYDTLNMETLRMLADAMDVKRHKEKLPKVGVFLSSFQPFHLGHLNIIKNALVENDRVVVIIGSSNKKDEQNNPLHLLLRHEILDEALKCNLSFEQIEKISVVYLPDLDKKYNYDSIDNWSLYLYYSVIGRIWQRDFTLYYGDPDFKTSRLNALPELQYHVLMRPVPRSNKTGELDSAELRKQIASGDISRNKLQKIMGLENSIKGMDMVNKVIDIIRSLK